MSEATQIRARWPYAMGVDEAAEYCGIGRNTLLRLVGAGRAPAPVKISEKRRVWLRPNLERWLDRLASPTASSDAITSDEDNPWLSDGPKTAIRADRPGQR
jgi:excisionase family DNA binding protein